MKQAQDERAERTSITADMVVVELKKHAFLDMRDFFDDEGRLLDVNELPANAAVRLSSIEVLREWTRTTTSEDSHVQTLEQTIKVRVWDKLRVLELFGRHLGMWNDKVEHGADVSLFDALRRIEAKEDAANNEPSS